VAGPGFDLGGGGRGLCQRGGGEKLLKVLTVEIEVHFECVSGHISIKIRI